MDTRTEQEKLDATAARSEIGERAGTVLVIAPQVREAQDWAAEHQIPYSRTIVATSITMDRAFRGLHGTPHVILRWYAFSDHERDVIKGSLKLIGSEPWEDPNADLLPAPPVRSGVLG